MLVSEELKNSGQDVLQVINETQVESLGLLENTANIPVASFLERETYLNQISNNTKVIITTPALVEKLIKTGKGVCVVKEPKLAFFKLHNYLVLKQKAYVQKQKKNQYGRKCEISSSSKLAPCNIVLGDRVKIEENVVIYGNTIIEDDVVIRSGAVIGGEGFECKKDKNTIFTVKHAGTVKIGRGSEIRYNACIDRALYPWDSTDIGEYSVLDNLVHIGHGVKIGMRNLVASKSVIGGRTIIGNDVWIGLGATVSNGLIIGDNCKINIGSVVINNIAEGKEVFGNPARGMKR